MSWTDERIEMLRKLWADGLSASQIATSLGGVTRNAVIGKIHRLGLSGRVKAPQRASRPRAASGAAPAANTAPVKAVSAPRVMAAGALAVKVVEEPEAAPAPQPAAEVVPITGGVGLMDLKVSSCRWPLGDPSDDDFRYCGARCSAGDTYCRAHAEQAFPSRRTK